MGDINHYISYYIKDFKKADVQLDMRTVCSMNIVLSEPDYDTDAPVPPIGSSTTNISDLLMLQQVNIQ
ncbi:MAG: hypothetical protein U5J96_07600 [Ignavibacteriaceae bacterium]|nr:hypothetical protein [Ignavibacteriaceae bacterium]